MRPCHRVLALIVLGGLHLGAIAGCGGSESNPPAPGPVLAGTYDFAGWTARSSPQPTTSGLWGSADFDGVKTVVLSFTENSIGEITEWGATPALHYDVGLDRTLAFRRIKYPGVDLYKGGLSADGDLAALADAAQGFPDVYVLSRRRGTWSESDLEGGYHICGYTYAMGGAQHIGWLGLVLFDGSGGGSVGADLNTNGNTSAFGPTDLGYTVTADGAVTLDFTSNVSVTGALTKGGDVIVVSGSTAAGKHPALFVLVRVEPTPSDATFDGAYFAVGLEYDVGTGRRMCMTGTATANGTGTTEWLLLQWHGTTAETEVIGDAYSVAANGNLSVTSYGPDHLKGGISASGDVAVLGRVTDPGANPTVYLLFN